MQREDFEGVFKAMDGFPVTIRLLDPPLHEFLPRREELMVEIAQLEIKDPNSPRLKEARELLRRVEELHELNPMLGHRGCRLGITYPEISEMQARAIFEAAVNVSKAGVKVFPEVMVPLVGMMKEMENQSAIIRQVAEQVFKEKGTKIEYMVGTMIELPRACSWPIKSLPMPSSSALAPTILRRRLMASRATTSASSCRRTLSAGF